MAKAFILAAPHSGAGKTLITLALIQAFRLRGLRVAATKVGPDYIDPQFHSIASGRACYNLDPWAMQTAQLNKIMQQQATSSDLVITEGVMGLFDGPLGHAGSTAQIAQLFHMPYVFVVDCSHQGQSIAALVQGFTGFNPGLRCAGIILNRVASPRHEKILRHALSTISIPILGAIPRDVKLHLPSRHLGLLQPAELADFDGLLASASSLSPFLNLDELFAQAGELALPSSPSLAPPTSPSSLAGCKKLGRENLLAPLGQTVAIARDAAFSFLYPHLLQSWRDQGCEILFFSPLANEEIPAQADAVYLPGGYPELYAEKLSQAHVFFQSLRQHKGIIYGECGGYMVLGDQLIDGEGVSHPMAGLLPLTTSFSQRKLHLGYRSLKPVSGPWVGDLYAHEFHYARILTQGQTDPLFWARDSEGHILPPMGQRVGQVMGSFAHIIAQSPSHSEQN